MAERVLICGSRPPMVEHMGYVHRAETPEYKALLRRVSDYVRGLPLDTVVLAGDADGVDSYAVGVAETRGMLTGRYRVCGAAWQRLGKAAGHIRNSVMLDSNVDRVVAFPFGEARGTRDCIAQARARGIPVEVIECHGPPTTSVLV